MDSKALMRSRVRDAVRSREKKLRTPLVRYNDAGQPVCNLCNVMVKSEALWNAHTSSRQHKTAVEEFKAKAAAVRGPIPSEQPRVPLTTAVPRARPASELPEDFFDARPEASSAATSESGRPRTKLRSSDERVDAKPSSQTSTQEPKQTPPATGSLPMGFFDNSDADSRARGIEPVKISIQDEYEQFRKSISEDVKGVDVRLDEEEGEAAEDREEIEQIEQRNISERIEAIKKRKQQKAVVAVKSKKTQFQISEEDDTSDESDEENLLVDWRAKQL